MNTLISTEILRDFSPRFRVYKDGKIERLRPNVTVAPSYDPNTCVNSKDVTICMGASARIYMPDNIPENTKLPLLIYVHGGAFCQFSAFSTMYHSYLNSLVSEAKVIAVSADYRLAPEHPIPTCFEDSWAVTQWTLSHSGGSGPNPWLNQWADFGRVFIAGESAGGTITHYVTARAGSSGLFGLEAKLAGIALVHPYFACNELEEIIDYLCSRKLDVSDPMLNPMSDTARMKEEMECCERVLVCVDKDDELKEKGVRYYEAFKGSGWKGDVQLLETNGGGHVFHLFEPELDKSTEFLHVLASFINKS